jgi:hypothetical protein
MQNPDSRFAFPDSIDAYGWWGPQFWVLVRGTVRWFSCPLEALTSLKRLA